MTVINRGPWLPTYTGRRFHHQDLRVDEVHPLDIAHALAHTCRYNGQTSGFYSVAEHCLLLADFARDRNWNEELQLECLIHDAAEAYVGDVILGLKDKLPAFQETEARVEKTIREAFGLKPISPGALHYVKNLDRRILLDERDQLFPRGTQFHADLDELVPLLTAIRCLAPTTARARYMTRLMGLLPHKPSEFFRP